MISRELKSRQFTVIKNWRILSGIRKFIAEIALDTIVMHRSSFYGYVNTEVRYKHVNTKFETNCHLLLSQYNSYFILLLFIKMSNKGCDAFRFEYQ